MFTHLHCHSYYSFLRGAASPASLAEEAARRGMSSLALTDTNGVYGAVEFYRACRAVGINPILGVEIRQDGRRAVFLARNRAGWGEICRLTTARQLEPYFSLPRAVEDVGENVFVFTDSPDLIPLSSHPHTYLEITSWMPPRTRREVASLARARKIPLLATNDVHFLKPADWILVKILAGIRTALDGKQLPPGAVASPAAWFKSGPEMRSALGEYPRALSQPDRIARACQVTLELGTIHLPRYPLASGTTASERLRTLCRKGLRRLYGRPSPRLEERLRKELAVISRRGFSDYFLLVEEIVAFARRRGIPTLGRGSAANSLVCYLLGITQVDPLKYNLYFERFLNPERSDPPDIDLDFPYNRRDEVIARIYRRFGEERVAMISTTVRFRARSALRETAKVAGLSEREANRLTRYFPYFSSLRDPERIHREVPECRHLPWGDENFRKLLAAAGRLEGFPRHLSVHPGGMVIAPAPLTRYLALERAPKGIVVTQFDMYAVKDLGLVKVDILGQRALAVVEDVLREQASRGRKIDFQLLDPEGDEATRELVASGRTIGCFYIESPIMRMLLQRLKCPDFETLVAASSIIRPGVSNTGLSERYLARRLGQEEMVPLHPRVDVILKETCGVMVYQEQVMKMVSEVAGMSLSAADQFRRCMSKKPGWEDLRNYRQRFARGALRRGIPPEVVEELWRQIEGFSAYAFCKAHSAAFARLSYQVAYLKANFPASFMASLISHRGGFYPTREYIQEALRMGLRVYPPDVNRSAYEYLPEDDGFLFPERHCKLRKVIPPRNVVLSERRVSGKLGRKRTTENNVPSPGGRGIKKEGGQLASPSSGEGGIRIGLMEIKHLRLTTIRRILEEREKCPFASLEEFVRRVAPNSLELHALTQAGALSSLGEDRPALAWKLAAPRPPSGPDPLFPDYIEVWGPPLPRLIENRIREREAEIRGLGFSRSLPLPLKISAQNSVSRSGTSASAGGKGSPRNNSPSPPEKGIKGEGGIDPLPILKNLPLVRASEQLNYAGREIQFIGFPVTDRLTRTLKGKKLMKFLTLEDESGLFEAVLFPDCYARYGHHLRRAGPFYLRGRVRVKDSVPVVICHFLAPTTEVTPG